MQALESAGGKFGEAFTQAAYCVVVELSLVFGGGDQSVDTGHPLVLVIHAPF